MHGMDQSKTEPPSQEFHLGRATGLNFEPMDEKRTFARHGSV